MLLYYLQMEMVETAATDSGGDSGGAPLPFSALLTYNLIMYILKLKLTALGRNKFIRISSLARSLAHSRSHHLYPHTCTGTGSSSM